MAVFSRGESIGVYKVLFFVKGGRYAESYRVKDDKGKKFFLKLVNMSKLQKGQVLPDGELLEFVIVRELSDDRLVRYADSGNIISDSQKYQYIVFDYISGETLSDKLLREKTLSVYEAKRISIDILNGLHNIHGLSKPVIHNNLTTQNIMLDLSANTAKIIGFGHARYLEQDYFDKEDLNLFGLAPECFNGVFTIQSDIYSVGAILYTMLFGLPPFFVDLSFGDNDEKEKAVLVEKNRPLKVVDSDIFELDEQLINTLSKALSYNVDDRFKTVEEFISALNGDLKVDYVDPTKTETKGIEFTKKGNGFSDIAGMQDLKDQLQSDVINILKNPDRAKELGISIPNGLLFYGPPGCGKTFFAEKFAEEIGCNYKYVKCSDVASPYIHGGQGKIAAIFEEARKNAPTILFFDEIDAMVKDRSKHNNVSEAGEVNEFLTQLNNCGKAGVLAIGATNKPLDLDEAIIRAGRLEYKYYIPQPDFATRKQMFEINLSKRSVDFGIDYDRLASLTENYISADIKLIVDNAARMVFRRNLKKITMALLEESISETPPSITPEMIRKHEAVRDKFQGEARQKKSGAEFDVFNDLRNFSLGQLNLILVKKDCEIAGKIAEALNNRGTTDGMRDYFKTLYEAFSKKMGAFYVNSLIMLFEKKQSFTYAVTLRGEVIGLVLVYTPEFNQKANGERYWSIEYFLLEGCEGKGYMTLPLLKVVDYILYGLKINSIDATIDETNIKSIRLVERVGFERIGRNGFASASNPQNMNVTFRIKR